MFRFTYPSLEIFNIKVTGNDEFVPRINASKKAENDHWSVFCPIYTRILPQMFHKCSVAATLLSHKLLCPGVISGIEAEYVCYKWKMKKTSGIKSANLCERNGAEQ